MEIKHLSTEHIADDLYCFRFSKPAAVDFDAGDYVELELQFDELGGRRWFTISSSPSEDWLEFTTKVHPEGSSFKQHLKRMEPGDSATISPPIGTFNLPRNGSGKLLWVAAGIGATPFLSMSRELRGTNNGFDITTVYIAKPNQFYFEDELKEASSDFHKTSERIGESWFTLNIHDLHERTIYLSGPEEFCTGLFEAFLASGVPRRALNLDYFPGYDDI